MVTIIKLTRSTPNGSSCTYIPCLHTTLVTLDFVCYRETQLLQSRLIYSILHTVIQTLTMLTTTKSTQKYINSNVTSREASFHVK